MYSTQITVTVYKYSKHTCINEYSLMYTHFVQKQHRQVRIWTRAFINAKTDFIKFLSLPVGSRCTCVCYGKNMDDYPMR